MFIRRTNIYFQIVFIYEKNLIFVSISIIISYTCDDMMISNNHHITTSVTNIDADVSSCSISQHHTHIRNREIYLLVSIFTSGL